MGVPKHVQKQLHQRKNKRPSPVARPGTSNENGELVIFSTTGNAPWSLVNAITARLVMPVLVSASISVSNDAGLLSVYLFQH